MNNIYELGNSLQGLLSGLKKNREYVGTDVLKTQYKAAYENLLLRINQTATAFAKEVTLKGIAVNPDIPLEDQIFAINQTIANSGLLKEMGKSLSRNYDVEDLHRLALVLRGLIESDLRPYVSSQDCLVADLFDIEQEPVIYNTLTKKVYKNDTWVDQELDLQGKLLVYLKPDKDENTGSVPVERNQNGSKPSRK